MGAIFFWERAIQKERCLACCEWGWRCNKCISKANGSVSDATYIRAAPQYEKNPIGRVQPRLRIAIIL